MAKEMMIIFVYDTELLKREEDDPASAILYFYPNWVSDMQRTSLCGQIVGSWHFLKSVFGRPKIFALQSGKFSIRTYGRYLLAIGTDRNIADWLLEHRADTLTSLISIFHRDLQKMSELYKDSPILSAKLYHMFETYLKILMYGGHMFFNVPTMQVPKSASQVFLEAVQLLECCQQLEYVLGGTILYHNKIVTTQLSSDLTKMLVLTDPYRIKSPAEICAVNFQLPMSVQLLQIYIKPDEYSKLLEDSGRFKSIESFFSSKKEKQSKKVSSARDTPILSTIKRDQSIIFTTVPEEGTDLELDSDPKIIPAKSLDRPKFLNLKNKTTDPKYDPTVPKQTQERASVTTPYHGTQSVSVCSTPMTDLSKVVHQNLMSICVDPDESEERSFQNGNAINLVETDKSARVDSIDDSITNSMPVTGKLHKKSASMQEFREKLRSYKDNLLKRMSGKSQKNRQEDFTHYGAYQTISDPMYPFFKANGLVMSESLRRQYMDDPTFLEMYDIECLELNQDETSMQSPPTKSVDDQDTTPKPSEDVELQSLSKAPSPEKKTTLKERRRSLNLPLKSLSNSDQSSDLATASGLLTPLMSKLSSMTFDSTSGFCSSAASRDVTPLTDFGKEFRFKSKDETVEDTVQDKMSNGEQLREAVLFVCGQQDMVMCMILEVGACETPDVINRLWEMCTESLGRLEKQLRHCLEAYSGGSSSSDSSTETYSYLCLDPQWDTIHRGGPWSSAELGALTHLHRDFINTRNVTEILLRNDESVMYAHHCGEMEVFYQQAASSCGGLPTPVDTMANVALKAKRRLERDHGVVLL